MRADNTHHLVQAAQHRRADTARRAAQAIRRLDAAGQPVTFSSVAAAADVSRSWLYRDPDTRGQRLRPTVRRFARAAALVADSQGSASSVSSRTEPTSPRSRGRRRDGRNVPCMPQHPLTDASFLKHYL